MTNLDESLQKLQTLKKRPDGVTSSEWRIIQKGVVELQKRKEFDPKKHKAITQSDLARTFIKWYFAAIFSVLVFTPLYNCAMALLFKNCDSSVFINLRDAFMMVSGAITPILAFVLGHYFKGRD